MSKLLFTAKNYNFYDDYSFVASIAPWGFARTWKITNGRLLFQEKHTHATQPDWFLASGYIQQAYQGYLIRLITDE